MKFYNLICEVPGGIGEQTTYDKTEVPWKIISLHMKFEGWLGAEIMVSSSALMVSNDLKKALGFNFSGISGYQNFLYEKSENFKILQPNVELPKILRIIVESHPFVDDFAMAKYNNLYNQLIIYEKARIFIEEFNLGNYQIEIIDHDSNSSHKQT